MTKMKIKNRNCAASPGLFRDKDNTIELLEAPLLAKANSNFYNFFPEEQSLRKTIDPDTVFFYTVEHFSKQDKTRNDRLELAYEKGIAKIAKKGKRYFLERQAHFQQRGKCPSTDDNGCFNFEDGTYLVVGSYAPQDHNEVYALPHSIAYTADQAFTPQILQLDDKSVLGRLDGDVQSIDQDELKQILGYQDPIHILTNHNGPLVLNSKFLELVGKKSMILSDQVALKPQKTRPREKQAGSIIFNEKKSRFEGYDGEKWRPLKWGDE